MRGVLNSLHLAVCLLAAFGNAALRCAETTGFRGKKAIHMLDPKAAASAVVFVWLLTSITALAVAAAKISFSFELYTNTKARHHVEAGVVSSIYILLPSFPPESK